LERWAFFYKKNKIRPIKKMSYICNEIPTLYNAQNAAKSMFCTKPLFYFMKNLFFIFCFCLVYAVSTKAQCSASIYFPWGSCSPMTAQGDSFYPHTYRWSNGDITNYCSSTSTGTYTVTVTNVQGCSTTASYIVTSPLTNALIVNITSTRDTLTCAHPTATLSATSSLSNVTYSWNLGSTLATGSSVVASSARSYSLSVNSSSGCNLQTSKSIESDNTFIDLSMSIDNCFSSISSNVFNPNTTYQWSNGESTTALDLTISHSGTYTVTATNSSGCITTGSIVANITNRNVKLTSTPTTGGCTATNGSILATAINGTPPYTYRLDNYDTKTVIAIQNTPLFQNLGQGTYSMSVSDASGCSTDFSNEIRVEGSAPIINFRNITNNNCQTTSIRAEASGLNSPFTYLWADGSTNPLTTNPTSVYAVTVTNSIGCSIKKQWATLSSGQTALTLRAPLRNHKLVHQAQFANCSQSDGGIYVYLINIQDNYKRYYPQEDLSFKYRWSNGDTTTSLRNVPSGWYSLTVTQVGCDTLHRLFYVPSINGCKTNTAGNILQKHGTTACVREGSDTPIAYARVELKNRRTQQITTVYTNNDGYYQAEVDTGRYAISAFVTDCGFTQICNPTNIINLTTLATTNYYANNNFYFTNNSADLRIRAFSDVPRPVIPRIFSLYYKNNGANNTNNAIVSFNHDARYTNIVMQSGSPAPTSSTATTKTWNIGALAGGKLDTLNFTMQLPQNIAINTLLDYTAAITSTTIDCDTTNNRFAWSNTVVNSFDPNDKTLLNRHNAQGGILNDGAPLTYQIRFQNTGTAEALDIVVRDTLDLTHLDKSTFKIIGASHPNMRARFEGNNIVVFEFPNINLIDSFHNEPASHGWLQFSIKPKANTPLYTVIDNTAAIFFDYNDPVITNTTHNTFVPSLVATENTADAMDDLKIQPNPTSDILRFVSHLKIEKCEVFDNIGRLVSIAELQNNQISIAHLPQGIYFIKVFSANGSAIRKVVKM
jgi:Secretion system C-terminal sorting domain/Domain of unknown function DUF11